MGFQLTTSSITFRLLRLKDFLPLSTVLRTKDNVDHAGLSPLLLLLKDTTLSKTDIFKATPSNNLLTAIKFPMVAKEVFKDLLSLTMKLTLKQLRPIIHTLVKTEHVRTRVSQEVLKSFLTLLLLLNLQNSLWLLLLKDQPPSPLKLTLILSKDTNPES